jgi:uncharacterized membrane protein
MSGTAESKSQSARRFLVDFVMFVSALGTIVTGVVLWLCVGKGPTGQKFFLGLHRHEWGDLHTFFSLAFVVLVVVHLIQHWGWIRIVALKQVRRRAGIWRILKTTGATMLVLATVWACFAAFGKNPESYGQRGRARAAYRQPRIQQNEAYQMPASTSGRRLRRGWTRSEPHIEQPQLETDVAE